MIGIGIDDNIKSNMGLIHTLTRDTAEVMDDNKCNAKYISDYTLWELGIPTYEDSLKM